VSYLEGTRGGEPRGKENRSNECRVSVESRATVFLAAVAAVGEGKVVRELEKERGRIARMRGNHKGARNRKSNQGKSHHKKAESPRD